MQSPPFPNPPSPAAEPAPIPDVTWFRLGVRAIGVLLIAWSGPSLIRTIISFAWALNDSSFNTRPMSWWWAIDITEPLLQVAAGLYLLIGAKALVNYCTRGALGMCPACNYDIRNIPGALCPECGAPLPGRKPVPASSPSSPVSEEDGEHQGGRAR